MIALGTAVFHYHNPFQRYYRKYRQNVVGDKKHIVIKRRKEKKMFSEAELQILALYAQIVTPILAVLGIIVSWIIYIGQKRKEQKEKAIEIGLEIEPIMHSIAYIDKNFELESQELIDILLKADRSKMKLFEYDEMLTVYSEEEIKVLRKYFPDSGANQKRIGGPGVKPLVSFVTLLQTREMYYKLFDKSLNEIDESKREDILLHEFRQIIIDTLNRLETLCLKMIRKVADERAVYQAIQPNFLTFVSFFYYYISVTNINCSGDDKKMKHVIQIYNLWRKRYIRNQRLKKIATIWEGQR